MCTCVYLYVRTCLRVSLCTPVCVRVCLYVQVCARTCTYVCLRVCTCVHVIWGCIGYVYMYVGRTCISIHYVRVGVYVWVCTCVHVCECMFQVFKGCPFYKEFVYFTQTGDVCLRGFWWTNSLRLLFQLKRLRLVFGRLFRGKSKIT